MYILGLGHQKEVGKDTLAASILTQCRSAGYTAHRFAFADALKREVNNDFHDMFPTLLKQSAHGALTGAWRNWCVSKNIPLAAPVRVSFDDPMSPLGKCREALQWWGTDYRRATDLDYWVRQMRLTLIKQRPMWDVAVITDMKFPNEFDMIKDAGGDAWKLVRLYEDKDVPPYDPHPSEHALSGYPFDQVVTASTLEELYFKGNVLFDKEFERWKQSSSGLSQ